MPAPPSGLAQRLEELRLKLPQILQAALDQTGPSQSSTVALIAPHKGIEHCIDQLLTWASYHEDAALLHNEDFIQATAYLWICYAQDHPLIDGNKRFATHVAMTYLQRYGLRLDVSDDVLATFARDTVATTPIPTNKAHTALMQTVCDWISAHIVGVD